MGNSSFIFKGYEADIKKGQALFHYVLKKDGEQLTFTEKIFFPSPKDEINEEVLKRVLDSLLIILGISYWKTYCPERLVLESQSLTKEQASFWDTVYTKGLGEFFYKNNIDFRDLVHFPNDEYREVTPVSVPRKNRSLLPLGGGKDSIVSTQLLLEHKKPFDLILFNTSPIQEEIATIVGRKPILIRRELDAKLFSLNKRKEVFNGHIPISAIYAFLGVFAALLYDYRYVIASNERSANYGNVVYLGETVNHQWSKSLEFEKLFQTYVSKHITGGIHYFSLLRPFTELKITEQFAKYPKYFSAFSSCNRNFTISKSPIKTKWCGECAKCAFVFGLLAAFLPKEDIIRIFGENLFVKKELLETYRELLGLRAVKPFECVGTPEEVRFAMYRAHKRGDFTDDVVMKMFKYKVLSTISDPEKLQKEVLTSGKEHLIPREFKSITASL